MDATFVTILAIVALLVMIALKVPVALSLAAAGLLGIAMLGMSATPSAVIQSIPFSATAKFTWTVIPMFVLMGSFATASGLVSSLFRVATRVFSWLPGGLGLASVAACAGFAAISGSSVATAASLGSVAGREMYRGGYRGSFAAGIIASAGTLGVLIPPSIVLVIYGITTGESIGRLLLAGIVPGIISACVIGLTVIVVARFLPQMAFRPEVLASQVSRVAVGIRKVDPTTLPSASSPEGDAKESDDAGEPSFSGLGLFIRIMLLFGSVMGGIYLGWFTVTEAAAVGALISLLIALFDTRRNGRKAIGRMLIDAGREAASTTGMLFLIVVGASIFTYFFVLAGVPGAISAWVLSQGFSPLMVAAVVLLIMLPLGLFLEPMSIILIVMPLAYPILVTELGFSGIWFGILAVKMIEIGLITPPIGLNVFVTAGVMKGIVTTAQAFKGVTAFVIADIVLVIILFLFPDIVLAWIPGSI